MPHSQRIADAICGLSAAAPATAEGVPLSPDELAGLEGLAAALMWSIGCDPATEQQKVLHELLDRASNGGRRLRQAVAEQN